MNLKCDDIVYLIHSTIKCQVCSIDACITEGILNSSIVCLSFFFLDDLKLKPGTILGKRETLGKTQETLGNSSSEIGPA